MKAKPAQKKNKIKITTSQKLPQKLDENAYLQVGALLEDMHSNFKIFAENQSFMQDKLDGVGDKLDGVVIEIGIMKEDISGIKMDQVAIKEDISGIKTDLKETKDIQVRMETDIKEIKAELKSIKNEIQKLKLSLTQKAELEFLLDLEKRVIKIEETIQNQ